ncbi:MFS transporter [Klenkia terrae]|uniref:MFS transporter n=1 Tax=Klenkia terrae TaxID=1052259 RepID=A0ABU8E6L0_9ACTN|nr:MFS transporter [Klenkia terrae]SSC25690.1 Major facilitator superfamily protein [Klenkia terrae]
MPMRLPRAAGFAVASAALVLVFVSAGSPIPLYNTYRAQDGLTDADLSVVTAVYLSMAAVSLLVLGRLSDHLGRRAVGLAALVSSAVGLVLLLDVDGVGELAAGRAFQGLATGLASSALGAYVVDTAPPRRPWLPAVVTGASPMLGIPLGALLSGALVDHGPAPRQLTFVVVGVLLAVVAVLLALGPETVPPGAGRARGAAASLRPRVLVPAGARRPLLAMAGLILATWSVGGFYQAFGPSIAEVELGSTAALTAGAVFASFTVLAFLGGPLTARVPAHRALQAGMLAYAVCMAGVLWALHAGATAAFLVVSLVAGVTQGVAQTGGMQTLLARTAPGERAGLLSTVFLLNYSCAAVPSLVAGRLTTTFSLFQIACGYAVLVVVGVVVAVVLVRPVPAPPGLTAAAGTRSAVPRG